MGYDNRIRTKYTAKWGVQIAGMIFQTRSRLRCIIYEDYYTFTMYGILYADSINRGRNVSTNNPASNISASVILSVNL